MYVCVCMCVAFYNVSGTSKIQTLYRITKFEKLWKKLDDNNVWILLELLT